MSDLISRDEALKKMNAVMKRIKLVGMGAGIGSITNCFNAMLKAVEDAPAVDAAPVVHGRWIQNKTVPSYHFCSNCKRAHNLPKSCNVYVLPFYCSDCGARMDKEVKA